MFKKCLPILLTALLLLSACGAKPQTDDPKLDDRFSIVATTYPVYLFTLEVTRDVPDVSVTLMIDQLISCIHDYTLSVNDMKILESADVIVLNGAGLETAMANVLRSVSQTPQIDCSKNIPLQSLAHHHSDGSSDVQEHFDPHVWMDPNRAGQMIATLAQELSSIDPGHSKIYEKNAQSAQAQLKDAYIQMKNSLSQLSCRELITFHNGFSYFADAFDLTVLRSIEEEAGSEASAQEVGEIIKEIEIHNLPAIFTERNGSTATAETIQRETKTPVFQLDLMMSKNTASTAAPGLAVYLEGLQANVETLREAYS